MNKKMVRHIRSRELSCWRMLQVRIKNKWVNVMDIEDEWQADEIVAPLQRAFDALIEKYEKLA